ncbi:hypothetical protein LCGC14_2173120 [marine sediment metagenome]|uniref:Uncharacterized protein n=1 Tax=marine sediment metagenome TaxID=412755 RepID=A0A0F9GK99_9ZZZZ
MNAVIIKVSLPILEKMLCLNKINLRITRVRQTWDDELVQQMELMLEGDSLDECDESRRIPIGVLEIKTENNQIVSSKVIK